MEKIDRLGWAAGVRLTAYGRRIGIRLSSAEPALLERAASLLPPGARPCRSRSIEQLYSVLIPPVNPRRRGLKRFNIAFAGPATLIKSTDLEEVWEALETDLELHLAETAAGCVFVHAGVVEWGGKALVLPGRTFSGKTSLVMALARAGARFYSDEYAVFDQRGRVHPYPRPLSVRSPDGHSAERRTPQELGLKTGSKPVPVGLVLSTEYRPEVRRSPRRLSPGQGALELLAHAAAARSRPAETLQTLRRAVRQAALLKGPRPEATPTAEALLSMIG